LEVQLRAILTSALDEVSGQFHDPAVLSQEKEPPAHTGQWDALTPEPSILPKIRHFKNPNKILFYVTFIPLNVHEIEK